MESERVTVNGWKCYLTETRNKKDIDKVRGYISEALIPN